MQERDTTSLLTRNSPSVHIGFKSEVLVNVETNACNNWPYSGMQEDHTNRNQRLQLMMLVYPRVL